MIKGALSHGGAGQRRSGGAALLQLSDLAVEGIGVSTTALGVGVATSAVTGVAAIWLFVELLKKRSFHRFAPYCWFAGAAFLAFLAIR